VAEQAKPMSIDDYIQAFPPEVRSILEKIRSTIREVIPEAKERISYRMPAFSLQGDVIYFAAFKNHIGIYPPVRGDEKLKKALARYQGEKGNLKFPLDEPIPYALIRRVTEARAKEQREKAALKQRKR
jgi:uncharacterized protein YdhG (YjbR/CyaY superfamily)